MECLDGADRFLYTGDDNRYASCERAIHQVTRVLQQLVASWKVRRVSESALFKN